MTGNHWGQWVGLMSTSHTFSTGASISTSLSNFGIFSSYRQNAITVVRDRMIIDQSQFFTMQLNSNVDRIDKLYSQLPKCQIIDFQSTVKMDQFRLCLLFQSSSRFSLPP